MTADDVRAVLERNDVAHMLIGGHAVAARGYPRFTSDVDFMTTDRRVLDPTMWKELESAGAKVDARRGDYDDPLGGVVHITLPEDQEVDVVVGKYKWEHEVLERAELLEVAGMRVPVPRTADLILLKLSAGGYHDLNDAHVLLGIGGREQLIDEIEERIQRLPKDIKAAWQKVLGERK